MSGGRDGDGGGAREMPEGFCVADGKLRKTFRFKNFADAFAWMTRVAAIAEKFNHHPEWTNVYNRVEVALVTHDAGAITERDYKLAHAMNEATQK